MHLQDETAEPLFFEPPLWSSKPLHDPPDRPAAAASSSMRLVFWSKGGAAMNLVNESQMTGTLLQVRHRSSFVWTIATHGPCWAMLGQRGGPGRRFTQDSVCIVSLHSLPFFLYKNKCLRPLQSTEPFNRRVEPRLGLVGTFAGMHLTISDQRLVSRCVQLQSLWRIWSVSLPPYTDCPPPCWP